MLLWLLRPAGTAAVTVRGSTGPSTGRAAGFGDQARLLMLVTLLAIETQCLQGCLSGINAVILLCLSKEMLKALDV